MRWSVSPYFFCVYICLCKKAYHLLLDQSLPMAPPLLLSLPLLPPLPPSLRLLIQVSARFSSADHPPPNHTVPCSLLSAAPTTSQLQLRLDFHLLNDGCFSCTTNSLAVSPLLSLSNRQINDIWIDWTDVFQNDDDYFWPKVLKKKNTGKEGDRRRKTVWSAVCQHCNHSQPACRTSPANHSAATC